MEIKSTINKRASKRYTYLPQARFESQQASQGIQIRDISKSGLQFFSNALIKNNSPIVVNWQDPDVGALNPFLMVVRKIEQAQPRIFRYCYGSQYFNLRHETKQHLEKLVTLTKEEERIANQSLISKITATSIVSIIKQGRTFLHDLLKKKDPEKLFVRFTRDLKDYEKTCFNGTDDDSQMIQKLTTHNFHINLLNIAVPLVPKSTPQGFDLYKETVNKIQLIGDVIIESKKINDSKLVVESSNRLFYNKLELLQTFVETYESDNSGDESIKKIVSEYKLSSPKPRR